MRELSHLHWGKKYYDEGAYDKALAHVGRALHYGVSGNKNRMPDAAPPHKPITTIRKPTRREKCSECPNKSGPFMTHYDEEGTRIMCTRCYNEKNEQKKDQCSMCGRDEDVREYIDRESDGLHILCTECRNGLPAIMNLEEARPSRLPVSTAAQVDPDTIQFEDMSIHGLDNYQDLLRALNQLTN